MSYCCEEFRKTVEEPESTYNRRTTFTHDRADGFWWTDFSDSEYGDIKLKFCPFCGANLQNCNSVKEKRNE